ncbi:MAG: hypothetical protein M0Q48_05530 [Verrucomicrobia bacterium]|nr:hypothetical protein [Verrucomicrobiota bacterium]
MNRINFLLRLLFIVLSMSSIFIFAEDPQMKDANKEYQAKLEGIHQEKMKVLTRWKELPYQTISTNNSFKEYIESIKFQGEATEDLTEGQSKKLQASLYNMFLAYNQGNLKTYLNFRTPQGPKWKLEYNLLCSWLANKEKTADTNNENLHLTYETLRDEIILKASGGDYYKDFWLGVCFDSTAMESRLEKIEKNIPLKFGVEIKKISEFSVFKSDIRVTLDENREEYYRLIEEKNNVEAEKYGHWPLEFFVVENPCFIEATPLRETFRKTHDFLLANVYCFVKRKEPLPAIPILARFYWNESCQNWLPLGFARGYLEKMRDQFPTGSGVILEIF